MKMFRFDLTKAEIEYRRGWSDRYIVKFNDTTIKIVNYLWWEVEEPKNLSFWSFWTAWKLKRSILWEVKRREKKKRKQAKINLIKGLKND